MVCVLRLLWVANAPILDQLQLDEAFLNTKLALVLISELVHIVQKSARTLGRLLILVLSLEYLGHAHSDPVGSNISRAENGLMLAIRQEIIALIRGDGRTIYPGSFPVDASTPVRRSHRPLRHECIRAPMLR